MQLQCNSVSGAVLQYSLQYLLSAGAGQVQLGCAHFRGSGEPDLVSGMESSLSALIMRLY